MYASILYQRGVYPPETFSRVARYGLMLLMTTDDELREYLAHILTQVEGMRKREMMMCSCNLLFS